MTVRQADLNNIHQKEGALRKFDEFFLGSERPSTKPSPQTPSKPIQSLKPNSIICPIRHHAYLLSDPEIVDSNCMYCVKERCALWTGEFCAITSLAIDLNIQRRNHVS
jgi:hypothetical protein